ncbi:MAG: hypothetical protein MRJ96_16720 [Nitrospirales bacterium]|nr:hypothetical protein [Nitrospira sp.]MDR4503089.1 hypothetical protein [Nitrospirales bacterium]
MWTPSYGHEGEAGSISGESTNVSLNIRLSRKAIHPPKSLLVSTLHIPDIPIAKPIVGPPPQSAILEDDDRHRLMVLTVGDNGDLIAYMLDTIDLTPHLSALRAHIMNRSCATDRMEITGGLGCIALCVKEILETEILL